MWFTEREKRSGSFWTKIFEPRSFERFGFQKAVFQKVHLEKGGRLIIRVVLYSGQYGIIKITDY